MIKKIVVDTSVISKWVSGEGEERVEQAIAIFDKAQKGEFEVYAPIMAKFECGNSIWKKKIDLPKLKLLIEMLYSTPIKFIDFDERLSKNTLEIAVTNNITFYDAAFISLAEDLGGNLITDNAKHQRPSIKSKIKIIPLAEFK